MKQINSKWILLLILIAGPLIGFIKGSEARQKWVFKFKNRYEEKRSIEEQKKWAREGRVALDDIEMASFHSS
ncbi:MAG: hypothetical protein JNL51_06115 [Chitinophagaceae bacterium]|nr:hypothetical protein [Chitinophagaceae bacterium]